MGESRPSQGNILVIHDQLTTLEILSAMLAGQGHQVQPVMTGGLAVQTARELLPDLILLGTDLAKTDVYEVCAGLKADDRTNQIPVIFIDPEDTARVFATGGADYVTRPFQSEEVLARVQTHLAVRVLRKQIDDEESRLQHEIAERKRLEGALQEAEEQGRDLLANLSDVVFSVDSDGLVTYVSPAIESLSGHIPSEITSRHFKEFIYEEDQARVDENLRRILSGHGAGSEYQVVTKSGELRWVRTSSQPVFEGDRVTGVQGVLTDVTEQKQARERIREQNEFLTRVLESLTHPFYVVDANDYTIHMANAAARAGRLAGEVTCYALTHARSSPCSTADHPCPLEEIKRTKAPATVEHLHYGQDGELRHVEVHGYPLFDDEGEVVRVIEYTFDITERKEAEEKLQKLAHDLGERVKELNCLYGVSSLASQQNISLEEILQGTIDLIPPGWQYPKVTCARIVLDGQEFRTQNFQETDWKLATEFVVGGERTGMLEVCYLEERPAAHEGPFLQEERYLIDAVAGRLGRIVERMQAQDALRKSEKQYRELLEALQEGIWVIDQDALTTYVNPRMAEMLGYTVEEMLGEHLFAFMDERGVEISTRNLERREQGIKEQHDFEFLRKDGSRIYTTLETSPIYDDDGQYVGGIAGIQDITERRRAEEGLQAAMAAAEEARREEGERRREAERHLQVAESLADVLAALNSNQPLERVLDSIAAQAGRLLNNQAVAIYRQQGEAGMWAMEAAHGLPDDFASCGDMPPVQQALEQAVASRQPISVTDVASVLDGGGHPALGSERLVPDRSWPGLCQALLAVPVVAKDEVYGGIVSYYAKPRSFTGEEVELAVVFSDQVALAIENARLREQVQQAAVIAERSRLARDLHDSVTQALFSATLVAEVLPQVWRRDPEEAQQGLEELRHLTRSALAEMRTMLLELRPTALLETKLDGLLQQLTEAITSRAQLRVALDLAPIPTLPPKVHVTFYRVAQEALHNAVKHAEASQLIVSLRASPPIAPQAAGRWLGQVVLQVSDDGLGFDPSHMGPGQMGVAIMSERAEAAGAMLTIEGQVGQGTQVTLVWQKE